MKINEAKEIIAFTLEKGIRYCNGKRMPVIGLVGAPGVGKTAMLEDLELEWGIKVAVISGPNSEPEDIAGTPFVHAGNLVWSPPEWYSEIGGDQKAILFIDELDRADRRQRNQLLKLLSERKIKNWKLPDDILIVCAINGDTADDTAMLDRAMVDRIVWLAVTPDPELAPMALRHLLDLETPKVPDKGIEKGISIRALDIACSFCRAALLCDLNEELVLEVLAGIVGASRARDILLFCKKEHQEEEEFEIVREYEQLKKVLESDMSPKRKAELIASAPVELVIAHWKEIPKEVLQQKAILDFMEEHKAEIIEAFAVEVE